MGLIHLFLLLFHIFGRNLIKYLQTLLPEYNIVSNIATFDHHTLH